MSELKVRDARELVINNYYQPNEDSMSVYLKSEADTVIEELKIKLKVQTSDAEAARKLNTSYLIDYAEALKRERHQKYKRCLAMSQEWRSYAAFCGMQSSCHNHRGFGKTAEHWSWKECHAWKCVKRWLELAEKFKPNNSTAQQGKGRQNG